MDRKSLLGLALAGALAATLVAALAVIVAGRDGNLAWDDADYLRRGLRIANRAVEAGPLGPLKAADDLLIERPKPPLPMAWVAAASLVLGRSDARPLVLAASVVPFALLLLATIAIARHHFGPWAPAVAVLATAAGPVTLSFGAKVMVETWLALALLLTLHAAALVLRRPTPARGLALGAAIGMAMMCKLTVGLLLPGAAVLFAVLFLRRHQFDARVVKVAAAIAAGALVVAGPWYVRNGRAAVVFGAHSSRWNIDVEARPETYPAADRLRGLALDVVGWPNLAAIGLVAASAWTAGRPGRREPPSDFARLAAASLACACAGLLLTVNFEPRIPSPAWPAAAVALAGSILARSRAPRGRTWALAAIGLVGFGTVRSVASLAAEPRATTYWAARDLIDELVAVHRVRTLGNVGDTCNWNVCKTGLMNELRRTPEDCHVLHDLSRATPEALAAKLGRLDAVIVLEDLSGLSASNAKVPGLNRTRDEAARSLAADRRFRRVEPTVTAGLPPMSLYVRRR